MGSTAIDWRTGGGWRRLGIIVLAMGVGLPLAPAGAAASVGFNFRISGDAAVLPGNLPNSWPEYNPAMAYNSSDNQYLVVWEDDRNDTTRGRDIYGQVVAGDGSLVGSNRRISGAAATGDEYSPAVAYDSANNRYLVVWEDQRGTAPSDIRGQLVSADGSRVGFNKRISGTAAVSNEHNPAVAFNASDHEYMVVWEDERASAVNDIYGQRVSTTGNRVGFNFQIDGSAAIGGVFFPAVAWNSFNNEYLVTWHDFRSFLTRGADVYGQVVSGTGNRVGFNVRLSGAAATKDEYRPAVAYSLTSNEYLVVWEDTRSQVSRGDDIYGQRVANTGTPLGPNVRISGSAAHNYDYDPAVAWNSASNSYFVVWQDARDFGDPTRRDDIYGQVVGAAGALLGFNVRISGPTASSLEYWPTVAYNSQANEYLVVWEDGRNESTRGRDVYGQRMGP